MNVVEKARAYGCEDEKTLARLALRPHDKGMYEASTERANNRRELLEIIARQEKQIARLLASTKELRAENGALRHRIRAAAQALEETPVGSVVAIVREKLEIA